MKKFKVIFEIEGSMLGDDVPLTVDELRGQLEGVLDEKYAQSYFGNRSIDTKINIKQIKEVKPK